MQVVLIVLAIFFAIWVIVAYKWFFITAAILAVAGYVGYRIYKAKKAKSSDIATAESVEKVDTVVKESTPVVKAVPIVMESALTEKKEAKAAAQPTLVTNDAAPIPCENQPVEEKTHPEKCIPKVSVQADESKKAEIQWAYEQKLAQFDAEIAAIPRTDIIISEAAERRRVRDLPEYSFSNITRKTKLASIFPLVCIDVETTGLHPTKSEIIEITAIRFDRGMIPVSCFTTLCKPKSPIPPEATQVNNITDDMVAEAPAFAEIAPGLTEYIRGCNLVGHNLDFDLRFLFVHGVDLPVDKRFFDTLDLAHYAIPNTAVYNYKLDTLCSYYGIWRTGAHRSLSDCYATSKLLVKLVEDKTDRNIAAEEE